MRWSFLILIALSLACSKKESAPAEPEEAVEAETPPAEGAPDAPEGLEAKKLMENPGAATQFKLEDLPPLPPELGGETPALDSAPTVNVLESGAEPRRAIRWKVEQGSEQKLKVDVGMSVDAVIVLIRSKMPETVVAYDLTLEAKKVKRDGTVEVAFKVDDARSVRAPTSKSAVQSEAQKRALKQRTNVVGSYVLSPQGALSKFEVKKATDGSEANAALADSLRWTLGQLTAVFPDQPIGRGAKWSVQQSIIQGGIHANELRTFELVELDGKRAKLSVDVRQTAAPQPYVNPMTGAKFELETLNGIGKSSLEWDLGRLAPDAADVKADSLDGAVFRKPDQTQKASVAVHTERKVTVGK